MNLFKQFFWLFTQVYSALRHYWYINCIILAVIAVTIFFRINNVKQITINQLVFLIVQFIFPIIVLLWGAIFTEAKSMYIILSNFLIYFTLIIALIYLIFLLRKIPTNKILVLSIFLLQAWLTLITLFISGMSISGNWL